MNDILSIIRKEVFVRRPVLKEIAQKYSKESLYNYVKNSWQIPTVKPDPIFLDCFEQNLRTIYGEKVSKQVRSQLLVKPLVSTIDHHGIWNHPIFVNSALVYSLHFKPTELVITLPTESVSLNNTSSWSASLLAHGESGNLDRYSFFPDRFKTLPVFSAPGINQNNILSLLKKLPPRFLNLLEALKVREVVDLENFSLQASGLSSNFWQKVFPSAPKLIYLPLESLVSQFLAKVFEDPKHFLSRLVFTEEGRQVWQSNFPKDHTFMFWGIDQKGRRTALAKLPSSRSEILELMKNRQIYPSSPLCFAALLGAGVACVGGFTQTTWLSQTKEKLMTTLFKFADLGPSIIAQINSVPTKNFAETSLAWLKLPSGFVSPAAADLYLTGKDYYPIYSDLARRLTLGQSLDLMLPTIYSVVVPKAEQIPNFNKTALEQYLVEDSNIAPFL